MAKSSTSIYRTTVLMKAAMGASGAVMFGWLIAHMVGNLKVFAGAEAFNGYAAFLGDNPGIVWTGRFVVLGAVLTHIASAVMLTRLNWAARPIPYQHERKNQRTTYAARTMIMSGPIISAYIIYHLVHLTFGVGIENHSTERLYEGLVSSFQNPIIAVVYIVANLMLGMHLYHGAWSFFQSLGLNHPRYNALRRTFATVLSVGLTVGFVSIPVAVLLGIVK
jgi:succinate dehydrogenase / fumarate reductase cytochrome b subunit